EVRLAGIEAPNGGEPLAGEARGVLRAMLEGRAVSLFYGGLKRDRYERALAHVRLDEGRGWANGALLEQGLARVRAYAGNRALAGEMLERGGRGRAERLGLWGLEDYAVRLRAECGGLGGFQIVEGRVGAVRAEGGDAVL